MREHCGRELIILLQVQQPSGSIGERASIIVFARGFLCQPNVPRLRTRIEKLDYEDMIGDLLVRQIEVLSHKSPMLIIFEDAHWADPSSLEALGRLIDRIERLNALLIVNHRPEFTPPWIGRPEVTTLTVIRLGRREIDFMIDSNAGNKVLPEAIRTDIAERADGVPLFAEEIARAALEAADEGEAARAIAAIPSALHAVPASLHASLMARLDRLGEAKEVTQIGAAIGREFGHDLLSVVAREGEMELAILLDRLIRAGLVFRQAALRVTRH